MGKSPGKWIKTVLFGKKTARSNSVKGRNASKSGIDRGYAVSKGPPASTENSPVISEPVLVSTHDSGVNRELEKGNSSNLGADASPIVPTIQGPENQGTAGHVESNNPEKLREEHAAIKAQAVFRGFLARRAFHALKGIIKLQALVRGHLVRRQAIVTLHSTLGLIKFQALVRGQKVRSSGLGLEVSTKFLQGKAVVSKRLDSRNDKLYSNVFVCKLLSSSLVIMPLQILYDQSEPNSVFSWMERWTFSHFWKPPSEPKKTVESKPQPRRGGYAMETESGRSKRSVRRNSPANMDTISSNLPTEPEKLKRNVKKATASADSVQDHPQSELEKVKRNLRKVSSSYAETIDRSQVGIDTKKEVSLILEHSDSAQEGFDDSSEKTKKEVALTPEPEPVMETASKSITTEGQTDQLVDNPSALESNPLPSIDKEENNSVMNGELSVKEEDQAYSENQNNNKRRASFSAKSEYAENGVPNTPKVPSYMQATESAKAKLRGQNSPRFSSDSAEKNGSTRRHSLPSSTNGKVTSHSPRTQKILLASGKGGIRSDRSLLSSRDGNEKPIVEWRR